MYFFQIAIVFLKICKIYRLLLGFGIHFFTPIGPLSLDIGWRWRKRIPLERSLFGIFFVYGKIMVVYKGKEFFYTSEDCL